MNESYRRENQDLKTSVQQFADENRDKSQSIDSLSVRLEKITADYTKLTEENATFRSNIDKLKASKSELDEISKLKNSVAITESYNKNLKKKITDHEETIEELQKTTKLLRNQQTWPSGWLYDDSIEVYKYARLTKFDKFLFIDTSVYNPFSREEPPEIITMVFAPKNSELQILVGRKW